MAAALLLSACASQGRFLAVTDTSHGQLVWARYPTLADCERAIAQVRNDTRCIPWHERQRLRASR